MSDTETLRLARQIKNLKEKTESISLYNYTLSDILLASHPVGEVYISFNSTSPEILFGGTWVSFGAGRVLVGYNSSDSDFNASEKTGGEKTHTLTLAEIPFGIVVDAGGITAAGWYAGEIKNYAAGQYKSSNQMTNNQPHNNLQPYITVYMWKRVA